MSTGTQSGEFRIQVRHPTFQASDEIEAVANHDRQRDDHESSNRKNGRLRNRPKLHLGKGQSSPKVPTSQRHSTYLGSYGKGAENLPYSLRESIDGENHDGSAAPSPRVSAGHMQLQHLLQAVDVLCDTYGLSELRDGFFDASFYRPFRRDLRGDRARDSLPGAFRKHHPTAMGRVQGISPEPQELSFESETL